MAVVGRRGQSSGEDGLAVWDSDMASAATDTVMMAGLNPGLRSWHVGVQMWDAQGARTVASEGSFIVTVKTRNTQQWEAAAYSEVDAAVPTTLPIDGDLVAIRVVPVGVLGIESFSVVATGR